MKQSFVDFLEEHIGTKRWCVAQRLTPRLKERYTVALSRRRYADLSDQWERLTYGALLRDLQDAAPELLAALISLRDCYTETDAARNQANLIVERLVRP